jgi:hypothetical protein
MSQPYPAPLPPPPPPQVKKARKWPWIVGIVAAFLIGIPLGAASSRGTSTTTATTKTVTVPAAPAAVPPATPAPKPAEPAAAQPPAPPAPAGPLTQFGDGKYLVGTDVAAGSYKSNGPRPGGLGHCYWARHKDDTGSNIIANDLTEGPTRLTAKAGEYLEITGCDFTKA